VQAPSEISAVGWGSAYAPSEMRQQRRRNQQRLLFERLLLLIA
jgi:hypothetical protein